MDPIFINTDRIVVWTVSQTNSSLYCLYVCGQLYRRGLSLDQIVSEYNKATVDFAG